MAGNTFQKSSITIEAAQRIIAAAMMKASEMGKPMCITVCEKPRQEFAHLQSAISVKDKVTQNDKLWYYPSFA